MKSFGLEDVTISTGGVPGESDSMCNIFTVGENFSVFLLMLVKLLLSDELEYLSFLWFASLFFVCCSAAALDLCSKSDGVEGFVSRAFASFNHWGLLGVPGDFGFTWCCWGFCACLMGCREGCLRVVRGLFWAHWFVLAIATTSACPSGCVLITFSGCGTVAVFSG